METNASADLGSNAHTGVECVVCVGRKRRAERSCLECLESYCEPHLELHNTLHVGKRHKLVEPSASLQERICPQHHRLLEVYCRTDQQCICHVCITDQHRTHNVLSMEDVVAEMQIKLGSLQNNIRDRIENREKEILQLNQAVEAFKRSAEGALLENECLFTDLIHSMEERQRGVKELITAQKEMVVRQVEELLQRLQREMSDLQRRRAELEQLQHISNTHHHAHFLQGVSSIPGRPESTTPPLIFIVQPYSSFKRVTEAVSELINQLNIICNNQFNTVADRVQKAAIFSSPVPKIRVDLLQYAAKLTLNLNTAHRYLRLSEDNRKVTTVPQPEACADHLDRFDCRSQILCEESLQGGPQYWEVEHGGPSWVCLAVSYINIYRKGKRGPLFGRNPCSWSLRCHYDSYGFWHNNKRTSVSYKRRCSRVGVYLEHGAGLLAFYDISDMSLIHQVQTKFTEPLYAGFGLSGKGTHIKLCDLDPKEALTQTKMLM